jgi:hypothetical protein
MIARRRDAMHRPSALWGVFLLLAAPLLCMAQISGTVHDPSGAPVAQAAVALEPPGAAAPLASATDAQGGFHFERLAAGSYRLTVSHDGFETAAQVVTLGDKPVELSVALKLEPLKTSVTVSSTQRNSDPNYQALRKGQLQQVWRVNNLVLKRDAATFTFRSGSFSFLPPVLGRVAVAVFAGDGNLKLEPAYALAARYMKTLAHAEAADEDFTSLAVYFTDSTFDEITRHAERIDASAKPLESVLEAVQAAARKRTDRPASYLETLLGDDDVPNIEADVLAQLYNGETGGFRAFIHGKKHSGLRFILDPRGALPVMPAPEEVALLNYDAEQDADGIWYLSHLASEVAAGRVSSSEDHRAIAPERYRMDVAVNGQSLKISAQCALRFRALREGVRMVRFELLPDMEVSTATFDGGSIPFVQEARRHDGSFYLQFPAAVARNDEHELVFHYSGGEYIQDFGGRVLRIQPLRPWYPRIDSVSRALFDMTFHVPRNMTAVSVGKLARKAREGSQDVFEWTSDTPLPPAGFNYGDYRLTQRNDPKTGYLVESYLSNSGKSIAYVTGQTISTVTPPNASADVALTDARNSVELFEHWFGPLPYGRLGVVESPFAGSLPSLIFLPPATLGAIPVEAYARGMRGRVARVLDEALPAAASRQWWGGLIMPASLHETWLTRGLADFSAALYDEAVGEIQDTRQHRSGSHDDIMRQDVYGLKIREAPPVWFGLMTDIHSTLLTPSGPVLYNFVSNILLTRKAGFIFHMLRQLMRDPATGDRDFIAMMHDFTSIYANRAASTEDFRATVEKHMKPAMILDRAGNMQWFFDEWVYGTDIPSYRLEYALAAGGRAGVKLTGVLTQSGVSDSFRMRVRVYARLGKKTVPAVYVAIQGNHSVKFETTLPEEPKEVLLNAENDVLAERQEMHRVKTLAER